MKEKKDISCKIIETIYEDEEYFIGRVEWAGRQISGIDVRRKDKEDGSLRKGAVIPFSKIDHLVEGLIRSSFYRGDMSKLAHAYDIAHSTGGFGGIFERAQDSIGMEDRRLPCGSLVSEDGKRIILERSKPYVPRK